MEFLLRNINTICYRAASSIISRAV